MKKAALLIAVIIGVLSCRTGMENKTISFSKKEINYIPYYLKMYKADSLFLTNNFEGSYKILDSLFKIYPPLSTDNYCEYGIYLNSAVMSGHLDGIAEKVRFGYLHFGGIKPLHKNEDEMYEKTNEVSGLSEGEIKQLKMLYYNSLNLDLRKKMIQMFQQDQEVRLKDKIDYDEMDVVDENNKNELDKIFKKYGFPVKSLIGCNCAYDIPDEGRIDLGVMLRNQRDSVQTRYLPILLDGIKKGFCEPDVYAAVIDLMVSDQEQVQYFGTFTCSEDGGSCPPLSNPKKIDSIRKSIGLPHIKYYPWRLKQFKQE